MQSANLQVDELQEGGHDHAHLNHEAQEQDEHHEASEIVNEAAYWIRDCHRMRAMIAMTAWEYCVYSACEQHWTLHRQRSASVQIGSNL